MEMVHFLHGPLGSPPLYLALRQSRRLTRAEDIAAKFNITKRTAYRDLVSLGEAGVPFVAEAGVG